MSLLSLSCDQKLLKETEKWFGKLVWLFERDTIRGTMYTDTIRHGIVIDISPYQDYYIATVICDGERIEASINDLEFVEDWSEEVERKNCTEEKT